MQNSTESYYPCLLKEINKTKKSFVMTREYNKKLIERKLMVNKSRKKIRQNIVGIAGECKIIYSEIQ